jgi:osmotically inducible protein OsmC
MALSLFLGDAGFPPDEINTTAEVSIEPKGDGFAITSIALSTKAKVPGIDEQTFLKHAEAAKEGCPVSQALGGTTITLDATLIS